MAFVFARIPLGLPYGLHANPHAGFKPAIRVNIRQEAKNDAAQSTAAEEDNVFGRKLSLDPALVRDVADYSEGHGSHDLYVNVHLEKGALTSSVCAKWLRRKGMGDVMDVIDNQNKHQVGRSREELQQAFDVLLHIRAFKRDKTSVLQSAIDYALVLHIGERQCSSPRNLTDIMTAGIGPSSSVMRHLNHLIQQGWVVKTPSILDKRVTRYALSVMATTALTEFSDFVRTTVTEPSPAQLGSASEH
ncbi:MAG TPA: helix-turn-helix domain-containing protein [Alphaproteobacteria bacterium]|jgi:hypothetical protein